MKHRLCVLFLFTSILFMILSGKANANNEAFFDMLNEAEKQYLNEADPITVIMSPNKGPIQYVDSNGVQKGISLDLLCKIAELTSLKFETVPIVGTDNIVTAIDSNEAQILSGIPIEREVMDSYHVDFSESYLDCSYGIVLNRNKNLNHLEDLTLALTKGLDLPPEFKNVKNILRFSTVLECINAVQSQKADFTYGNSYVLEFYSQGYQFQNLCVIPFIGKEQQICFGVSRQMDTVLLSILNKAIDYIGSDGMMKITVKNVAASTQPFTLTSIISNNPGISILVSIIILALIIVLTILIFRSYQRKNLLLALEHQHHLLISEIANEYFYEYNYKTDTMTLTKETAEFLGCKAVHHRWKNSVQHIGSCLNLDAEQIIQLYQDIPPSVPGQSHGGNRNMDLQIPLKSGGKHWFRITRAVIYEGGTLSYVVGKMMDVQQEHLELDALMEKSLCDSFTGIYNASATREFVSQALKKLRGGTLFIIDLDCFKNVNDNYGHQMGDKVIKETSEILKSTFREGDIVGRIGGDEFIIFALEVSDPEFITMKCKQLQEKVNRIEIAEGYVQTISIGVVRVTEKCTFDQLYQQADAALYLVKENGRKNFHISNP